MKFIAIFIALMIAHQTCHSLPISESEEDLADISDLSDDSSSASDEVEQIVPVDGKLVKEIVLDPTESKKVLVFDSTKGVKTNDNTKTGFVNIEQFSNNDSEADDIESDSDSDEEEDVEETVEKPEVAVIESKKTVVKTEISSSEEMDLGNAPVAKPKTALKDAKDSIEVVKSRGSFKKVNPPGQGTPYVKKSKQENSAKKVHFNDEVSTEIVAPMRKANPAGVGTPYIRKSKKSEVSPKEKTPEDFEKIIEELKKEIQVKNVQGESDSSEEDEAATGTKDESVSDQLIKQIEDLKEEIRVEKGLEKVESSEEEAADYDDEEQEDESDEEADEESSSESEEEEVPVDSEKSSSSKETNKAQIASSEIEGIKNIKLTQTFDGQDESSSESSDPEETKETENKKPTFFDGLAKIIESLKEEIKEERKQAEDTDDEEYMNKSEESVDEKLLSIFKDLEVNESLEDIKHFNKNILSQDKPHLEIEKPENLASEEVKIGFTISNEESNEFDLVKDQKPIGEIEIIPIVFGLPPMQFPANDMIQLIEIVEIPEKDVQVMTNEVYANQKKPEVSKKNIPDDIMAGGVLSKVKNMYGYIKNIFG